MQFGLLFHRGGVDAGGLRFLCRWMFRLHLGLLFHLSRWAQFTWRAVAYDCRKRTSSVKSIDCSANARLVLITSLVVPRLRLWVRIAESLRRLYSIRVPEAVRILVKGGKIGALGFVTASTGSEGAASCPLRFNVAVWMDRLPHRKEAINVATWRSAEFSTQGLNVTSRPVSTRKRWGDLRVMKPKDRVKRSERDVGHVASTTSLIVNSIVNSFQAAVDPRLTLDPCVVAKGPVAKVGTDNVKHPLP